MWVKSLTPSGLVGIFDRIKLDSVLTLVNVVSLRKCPWGSDVFTSHIFYPENFRGS